jgi:hypothetical protein
VQTRTHFAFGQQLFSTDSGRDRFPDLPVKAAQGDPAISGKTANALGLELSQGLLARADELIE